MSQKKLSAVESEKSVSNTTYSDNILFECLASQIDDAVALISTGKDDDDFSIVCKLPEFRTVV